MPAQPGVIRPSGETAVASTNNQIYGAASTSRYTPAKSKTYELGTKWDLLAKFEKETGIKVTMDGYDSN